MSTDEAAFGVAPDLTPTGIWMQPTQTTIWCLQDKRWRITPCFVEESQEVVLNISATLGGNLERGSPFCFC